MMFIVRLNISPAPVQWFTAGPGITKYSSLTLRRNRFILWSVAAIRLSFELKGQHQAKADIVVAVVVPVVVTDAHTTILAVVDPTAAAYRTVV
jgi:hypothetical protein